MTSVFLQVRLDSSRLPRKALADLGGRTVVERCFEALARVEAELRVLVTEPGSVHELEPLAQKAGWRVFVGSKVDVLERFIQAARATETTTIVRATGDNPLVSAQLANLALERHREHRADHTSLEGLPTGAGVEVVETSALEIAGASHPDAYEREHVCPFLYRRPERFSIHRSQAPGIFCAPQARITLDTADDLAYLCRLWPDVYRGAPPELEDLIPWLNRHPR